MKTELLIEFENAAERTLKDIVKAVLRDHHAGRTFFRENGQLLISHELMGGLNVTHTIRAVYDYHFRNFDRGLAADNKNAIVNDIASYVETIDL